MYDIKQWKHVFKLDPNKEISDSDLEMVCESGTDAIIVGGTDDVTLDDVINMLARVRRFSVPCVLEVSNLDSITPGYDFYFIPMVLNSQDKKWVIDVQHEAIKTYGKMMDWDEVMVEGYCILNPDSKAFHYTNSKVPNDEDVIAYAEMAEKMFHMPIFYMEYSGAFGDKQLVKEVSNILDNTSLFYGGGIKTAEQAKEMSTFADVVIIGNGIYEDLKSALKTVEAVKTQ